MGLCKCPKRKVTNLFCFEHKVNVCENCLVADHVRCIVKSYLQWLQDSDFETSCCICQETLESGDVIRLLCYDVLHTACAEKFLLAYPAHTAPDGFFCPACHGPFIPHDNIASPVANALRVALSGMKDLQKRLNGLSLNVPDSATPPPPSVSRPEPEGKEERRGGSLERSLVEENVVASEKVDEESTVLLKTDDSHEGFGSAVPETFALVDSDSTSSASDFIATQTPHHAPDPSSPKSSQAEFDTAESNLLSATLAENLEFAEPSTLKKKLDQVVLEMQQDESSSMTWHNSLANFSGHDREQNEQDTFSVNYSNLTKDVVVPVATAHNAMPVSPAPNPPVSTYRGLASGTRMDPFYAPPPPASMTLPFSGKKFDLWDFSRLPQSALKLATSSNDGSFAARGSRGHQTWSHSVYDNKNSSGYHDHDEHKYRRKPIMEMVKTWLKIFSPPRARRSSWRRFALLSLIALLALIGLATLFHHLGRGDTIDDPLLDPRANPFVKVNS